MAGRESAVFRLFRKAADCRSGGTYGPRNCYRQDPETQLVSATDLTSNHKHRRFQRTDSQKWRAVVAAAAQVRSPWKAGAADGGAWCLQPPGRFARWRVTIGLQIARHTAD